MVAIEETHCPHIRCQHVEDIVGKARGRRHLLHRWDGIMVNDGNVKEILNLYVEALQ